MPSYCLCRNRGTQDPGEQEATWPGLLLAEANIRAISSLLGHGVMWGPSSAVDLPSS